MGFLADAIVTAADTNIGAVLCDEEDAERSDFRAWSEFGFAHTLVDELALNTGSIDGWPCEFF